MSRPLLLLVLLLTACQGNNPHQPEAAASSPSFDQNTVQTYNAQTREHEQKPPFGERSNQSQ